MIRKGPPPFACYAFGGALSAVAVFVALCEATLRRRRAKNLAASASITAHRRTG